jgi:predicted nuclease of predicted toxin-antitoxin system
VRVLLDECLPARLKRALPGHAVKTVPEVGWRSSKDGELLRLAAKSFDVFVTIDRTMERQHDLSSFGLGFIIAHVRSNRLVDFQPVLSGLAQAIGKAKPGEVIHIEAGRG